LRTDYTWAIEQTRVEIGSIVTVPGRPEDPLRTAVCESVLPDAPRDS